MSRDSTRRTMCIISLMLLNYQKACLNTKSTHVFVSMGGQVLRKVASDMDFIWFDDKKCFTLYVTETPETKACRLEPCKCRHWSLSGSLAVHVSLSPFITRHNRWRHGQQTDMRRDMPSSWYMRTNSLSHRVWIIYGLCFAVFMQFIHKHLSGACIIAVSWHCCQPFNHGKPT